MKPPTSNEDSNFDAYGFATAHTDQVRTQILERAEALAADEGFRGEVKPIHLLEAMNRFAPGKELPVAGPAVVAHSFWKRMGQPISGLTLVSAVLAIAFGLIGLYGPVDQAAFATGALDIAKIFAGAVVGSTGAEVMNTRRGGS